MFRRAYQLQNLLLVGTPIAQIPSWIGELPNLMHLELSFLGNVQPPALGAAPLQHLTTLYHEGSMQAWNCGSLLHWLLGASRLRNIVMGHFPDPVFPFPRSYFSQFTNLEHARIYALSDSVRYPRWLCNRSILKNFGSFYLERHKTSAEIASKTSTKLTDHACTNDVARTIGLMLDNPATCAWPS